ncbi:MAG: hypothetical protein KDD50_05795, partial [Bdellovibrionales bacterium]|nr:hypothetical protein [Bdellovibrionales bacterium]
MTTPINTSLFKKHRLKETQKLLWISLLGVFLGACSSNESTPSESLFNSGQCSRNLNSGSYANTITTEESYCSSPISYVSGETITGKATFQARIVDTSASPTEGLLGPGTAQAIKYAEIIVEDSQGNRVQCAETDSSGSFSFVVPQSVDSLKLRVMARANNSYIKTSVKVCPENESVYSLNTTFSTDGSSTKDIGTVNASATGDLLGGAFNIYNQVLEANSYLRSKVSNCSSTYQGCTDFSVAPKSNIYWEKGFNPNLYFTSDSSA